MKERFYKKDIISLAFSGVLLASCAEKSVQTPPIPEPPQPTLSAEELLQINKQWNAQEVEAVKKLQQNGIDAILKLQKKEEEREKKAEREREAVRQHELDLKSLELERGRPGSRKRSIDAAEGVPAPGGEGRR